MIDLKKYIINIDFEQHDNKIIIIVHGKAGSVDNLNPMYILEAIQKHLGEINDYNIHRKELILEQ